MINEFLGFKKTSIQHRLRRDVLTLALFLIVSSIFTREIIFSPGVIGHNWDWYIPPLKEYVINGISLSITTWSEHSLGFPRFLGQNIVYSIIFLFGHLGANGESLSKIIVLMFPALSAFGAYRLSISLRNIDELKAYVGAVGAGLFYGFSAVSFYWILGGALGAIFAGILLPFVLLSCYNTIRSLGERMGFRKLFTSPSFVGLNLLLIITFLFSVPHGIISLIVVIPTILILGRNRWTSLRASIVIFGMTIASISSSILSPIWYILKYPEYVSKTALDISNPTQYFVYAPKEFLSLFFSSFFARDMYIRSIPSDIIPFFILTATLLIIALLGLSFFGRSKSKDAFSSPYFWLILFFGFLTLSVGDRILGTIAHVIYSNPLSIFLRSFVYYQTFGSLAFAIILGIVLERKITYKQRSIRTGLSLLLLFLIVSFFIPWYSGDLGRSQRSTDFDGTLDNFVVQEDYKTALTMLENDGTSFSILAIPMTFSPYYTPTHYQRSSQPIMDNRYVGAEPSLLNSEHGVIVDSRDLVLLLESKGNIDRISAQVQLHDLHDENFWKLLGQNNIKYVLMFKDTQPELNPSGYNWMKMRNSILESGLVKEIVNGPSVSLFSINEDILKSRVYLAEPVSSPLVIVDDNQTNFWSTTKSGVILNSNTVSKVSGIESLDITVEEAQQAALYHYYTSPIDISGYSKLNIDLHSNDENPIIIKIEHREKGYFLTTIYPDEEWQTLSIPLDELKKIGTPDLSKIDNIQIEILRDGTILHLDRVYLSPATLTPKLSLNQDTTDRYVITIEPHSETATLVLQQSYHPSWSIYEGDITWFDTLFRQPYNATHSKLDYANAWFIGKNKDPETITMIYSYQGVYNLSLVVTLFTTASLLSIWIKFKVTLYLLRSDRTNL